MRVHLFTSQKTSPARQIRPISKFEDSSNEVSLSQRKGKIRQI